MEFLDSIDDIFSSITKPNSELSYKIIINFLGEEVYHFFQRSILSGEYTNVDCVTKLGLIEKKINLLEIFINQIEVANQGKNQIWSGEELIELKNLIDFLRLNFLNPYQDLVEDLNANLDEYRQRKESHIIESKTYLRFTRIEETINDESSLQSRTITNVHRTVSKILYDINIKLVLIDENLETSDDITFKLNLLIKKIKRVGITQLNDITGLLIHKAEFLKFKIDYRKCHSNEHVQMTGLIIPEIDKQNSYMYFYHKTIDHYKNLNESDILRLTNSVRVYQDKRINDISLEPLHHLARHYHKNKDESYPVKKKKIDDLIEICSSKISHINDLDLFDQVAFQSVYALLENVSFDLELKMEKSFDFPILLNELKNFLSSGLSSITESYLTRMYSKISELSLATNGNYYGGFILISFIDSFIDFLERNPTVLITKNLFKDEKKILNEIIGTKPHLKLNIVIVHLENIYRKTLGLASRDFRRMKSHVVKPVYLMKHECFIPRWQSSIDEKLFLDSSYILPIDFKTVDQKLNTFETFLNANLNALKNILEITHDQLEINMTMENFKKESKANEFKVVQIVSLFVSIATFVLINVKIFDNKTALESFGILLGLSACFFIFNFLFYFLTLFMHEENKKQLYFFYKKILIFSIIPIIFGTTSFLILKSEGGKTIKQIDDINKKMKYDSTTMMDKMNTKADK